MSDSLIFNETISTEVDETPFVGKNWTSCYDSNGRNYGSNQIIIDTTMLSNNGKHVNYAEGLLEFPVYETLTAVKTADGTAVNINGISNDYLFAPKSGSWNLIHNMMVEYNNQEAIAPSNFTNVYCSFKALTTFSQDDMKTVAPSILFAPDGHEGWLYSNGAATCGNGSCNNNNYRNNTTVQDGCDKNQLYAGNPGMIQRQQWLANKAVTTYGAELIATVANRNTVMNPVFNSYGNCQVRAYMCQIRLKDLGTNFFVKLGMAKNALLKFTINVNNCVSTITKSTSTTAQLWGTGVTYGGAVNGSIFDVTTVQSIGSNPQMIANNIGLNAGLSSAGATIPDGTTLTMSYGVGDIVFSDHKTAALTVPGISINNLQCRLYVPCYDLNPLYESRLLSIGTRVIEYTDLFSYQSRNIPPGTFSTIISNGLAFVERLIIVPFFSASSNGKFSPVLSPFASEPSTTSPLIGQITNFNVKVATHNHYKSGDIKYGFEHFMQNTYGEGAMNGGLTTGFNSGLISKEMWENNYQYYVTNFSRRMPEQDKIATAYEIIGTNNNNVNIDLYIFAELKKTMTIRVDTGARVA